jgi:rhodanese-related sulfurtransferase
MSRTARTSALLLSTLLITLVANSQYKNDNIAFKTVYIEEFCKQFMSQPNAILLDVRSQGEFDDTSSTMALNIGHLKPAKHIDIQELATRWHELSQYKDQPVYVLCSHSQRSRRASKMLADSGFSNIINVNGGMTMFNMLNIQQQCGDFYQTSNAYKFVSPLQVCSFLSTTKNVFILDVRSDSAFKGLSDERENAYGAFKNATHIPADVLQSNIAKIPKDHTILVVSDFNGNAASAAKTLASAGYPNVYVLFNGLDALLSIDTKDRVCLSPYWEQHVSYKSITPSEFDELAKQEKNLQIVDVRPADEFDSKSMTTWRNIGIIKNAVNIPSKDLSNKLQQLDKNKPVLVYQFSGPDAFSAAKTLTDSGFKTVYVLNPGLFTLRWQAANLKGKSYLKDWVVNIPAENQ